MIKKSVDFTIKHVEKSGDSRICSVQGEIYGSTIRIINVYSPSGHNQMREREEFFEKELPYYLRFNNSQTIVGGDWNCVLSTRDVSNGNESLVSKSLLRLFRNIRFSDIWFLHNRAPQYTYIRTNYGSRIDRVYCQNLKDNVISCEVLPVSFSDHAAVMTKIKVKPNINIGSSFWKLNTNLLKDEGVKERFRLLWGYLKSKKINFRQINNWWCDLVKPEIKKFLSKKVKGLAENDTV